MIYYYANNSQSRYLNGTTPFSVDVPIKSTYRKCVLMINEKT